MDKRKATSLGGFLWCAVHGEQLDGVSPLWGFVVANH